MPGGTIEMDDLMRVLDELLAVRLRPLLALDTMQKNLTDLQLNQNTIEARTSANEYKIQIMEAELIAQRKIIEEQARTIEDNTQKIRSMEVDHTSEISVLKDEISDLEDRSKQNNIIIHDFPVDQTLGRDFKSMAINFLKNKILKPAEILVAHPISKIENEKCRLIIRLHFSEDKWALLKLRPTFEEQGTRIQLDYSFRTRQKRAMLVEFRRDNNLEGKLLQKTLLTAQGRYEVIENEVVLLQNLKRRGHSQPPVSTAPLNTGNANIVIESPIDGSESESESDETSDAKSLPILLPQSGQQNVKPHSGLTPKIFLDKSKVLPGDKSTHSSTMFLPVSQLSLSEASNLRDKNRNAKKGDQAKKPLPKK